MACRDELLSLKNKQAGPFLLEYGPFLPDFYQHLCKIFPRGSLSPIPLQRGLCPLVPWWGSPGLPLRGSIPCTPARAAAKMIRSVFYLGVALVSSTLSTVNVTTALCLRILAGKHCYQLTLTWMKPNKAEILNIRSNSAKNNAFPRRILLLPHAAHARVCMHMPQYCWSWLV